MITTRTKIQLLVFALITIVGVGYVGDKYAQLGRFFHSTTYTVKAQFNDPKGGSGGIFQGAEVDYDGVEVGKVSKLVLTKDGVDVDLAIKNKYDHIPADNITVRVANRSAVGEQYVDLEPTATSGPYLSNNSVIPYSKTRTIIPISTDKILTDLTNTVHSVNVKSLQTVIDSLGQAFGGTGSYLQTIIDTGMSFTKTADANIGVTTKLIQDSNTVLDTQIGSEDAIRTFSRELRLFSGTLAGANPSLKKVIDDGPYAATQLQSFIQQNHIDLGELLGELVTTGRIVVKNLPGIQQILVLYPYVVEDGFTVVSKSPDTGLYDAHFGLIITNQAVCTNGYQSTHQRNPNNGSNAPMNVKAHCADPITKDNARGAQNAPDDRAPSALTTRATGRTNSPTVASYDPATGKVTWGAREQSGLDTPGTVAPASLGKESWKWLYLQPMLGH